MDAQGVELVGQASSASQLVPLLESSPWLERVEFTAPVTTAESREQFRIRASWEAPGGPGSDSEAPAGPAPRPGRKGR
jgi:hypothetical protein